MLSCARRTGCAALALWLALTNALGALGTQQPAKEIETLEVGKPVQREIAGGQTHSYRIRLDAGQLLKAVVEQKGVDVAVALVGPDGKAMLEVDSPNGSQGPEPVLVVVEAAGEYRLEVKTLDPADKGGRYEARIDEIRAATEKDRQLLEATKLYVQSQLLRGQGKVREALELAERAMASFERALGPDHPDIAAPSLFLGLLYQDVGAYAKAESRYVRALTIREKTFGPEHGDVAISLNVLAMLYQAEGEYEKAEPLMLRALAILEKLFGAEHPFVAVTLGYLGGLYRDRGEFAKAETFLERGLTMAEKTIGPDRPDVAIILNTLGMLYTDQGAYAKAEPLLARALSIYEKLYGPESPFVATVLDTLAILYGATKDYDKLEPLMLRSLRIYETTLGPDHPNVASSLANLGVVYRARGDFAKEEPLLVRALAIWEKAFGPNHPLYARGLNNLASVYQDQRAFAKAEELYRRALAVYERAFDPNHPDVVTSLNNLAKLQTAEGKIAEAVRSQARANDIRERDLTLNLTSGSELRKLQYLTQTASELDRTLSLQSRYAPADPAARRMALEIVLRRKGRALDAMTDAIETLRRHASVEDQKLLDDLGRERQHLAQLSLAGPGTGGVEAYRTALLALEKRVEDLEDRVSARGVEFRAILQPVTLAAVQRAIPRGVLLLEFAIYRPVDPQVVPGKGYGTPRCVAYLLSSEGDPQWVDLGEVAPIDEAITRLRSALSNPKRRDVRGLARTLDERVMRPVRARVGSTRHLLVAPDGELNLVPFGALVDERGRYLVERYELTYLSSGRDLLRLEAHAAPRQPAMVMADPAYGDTSLASSTETRDIVQKEAESGKASVDFGDVSFPPLAYTAEEAHAVGGLLEKPAVLTGAEASEVALKGAHAPSVLHIATHGFFLPDLEVGRSENGGLRTADAPRSRATRQTIENPLLRSGLALAGANARHSGNDDGVLTASEVAGLDLWGTQLVVLSACDTGVGEVRAGDGVYGLRRALVLAGSESQVMSLWAVSDRATRDLMVGYYRGLLRGEGRTTALRRVQLAMLRDPRTRHPFYWAGFIQSGAWSPLERN